MENTSIQLAATKSQIKLLSSQVAATPLSICSNGSIQNINPCTCIHYTIANHTVLISLITATPIIITMTSVLAPIICFMLGCGTGGVLIFITRHNHRKGLIHLYSLWISIEMS